MRYIANGATLMLGVASLALWPCQSAMAQDEAPAAAETADTGALSEIIVTAQKRSQSIEKVPISVEVVDGQNVTAFQMASLKAIAADIPNLTLTAAPSGSIQANIRGFGTAASNAGFEQTVALYVDGVYLPRPQSYTGAVFDVERIEVVKGTQGALFGKNASVGAISMITRSPDKEFGGFVNLSYNFRFQQPRVEAAMDVPLGETAAVRVSGLYDDANKGWVYNSVTNSQQQTSNEYGGRAKLVWDVTDTLRINGKAEFNRFTRDGDPQLGIGATAFPGITIDNPRKSYNSTLIPETGGQSQSTRRSDQAGFGFDWDIGSLTLTGITAWQTLNFRTFIDIDNTAGPNERVFAFNEGFRQFTQELRLATPEDGDVQLLGGVFYLSQRLSYAFDVRNPTATLKNLLTQDAHAYSGFGQLVARPADNLTLTLGARYTHEEKVGDLWVSKPAGTATTSGVAKSDTFDWSGNVEYEFAPQMRIYTSVSRGHKAPGFVNSVPGGAITPAQLIFPAEEATNYEIGLKARFLDGKARGSMALYNLDVDRFQAAAYSPTVNGFVVSSRDARARGVEAQLEVQATPELNINSSLAYNRAQFRDTKTQLVSAPLWTVSVGAAYETDLSDTLGFQAGLDYTYRSEYPHQFDLLPGNFTPNHGNLDARVGFKLMPSNVTLSVIAKNLTDERYSEFGFGNAFYPAGTAFTQQANQPRSFTVSANIPF